MVAQYFLDMREVGNIPLMDIQELLMIQTAIDIAERIITDMLPVRAVKYTLVAAFIFGFWYSLSTRN